MIGSTWPEQDAIDSWFKAHNLEARREVLMVLKNEVTKPRIEVQEKLTFTEKQRDYFEASHLMALEEINKLHNELRKRDAVIEAAKKCIKTYNAGNRVAWDESLNSLQDKER